MTVYLELGYADLETSFDYSEIEIINGVQCTTFLNREYLERWYFSFYQLEVISA